MYSGPGGSSQVPDKSTNGWKMLDPDNITGVGNKGSAPPTDFGTAAQAQAQSDQQATSQQTQANRPDQQTGFGSTTWTQNPMSGAWSQNSSLNPQLGGALSSLQGQAATNAATGPQSIADASNQAISANYNQAASRLNPQWQQSNEQMGAQLANEGMDPNSQAYRTAMTQQSQAQNDAYSSAMNNAIGMGNQTEQTQLAAQMQPYQQMNALQGYQNGAPAFGSAQNAGGTQYLQAGEAAAGMLAGQNQANQQTGASTTSGAASMIGSIMSDERVKTDIVRHPVEAAPGVPLATFEYKAQPGQHYAGVIAQDLEKVAPEHVATGADGIKRVSEKFRPFAVSPHGFKPFGGGNS